MENSDTQELYTTAYLDFHKSWETRMDNLLVHLNEAELQSSNIIKECEELDTKLREFPFNRVEEQSAALRNLSDALDEARFKFSHQRKQELAEQTKILQAQIDAWGLPKPINAPFQVVLRKKGRKATETEDEGTAKKQRTDITSTENRFAQLTVEDMDIPIQAGTPLRTRFQGQPHPARNITFPHHNRQRF
ncbi:hypothetical protein TNCV_2794941 [Trichonephila clavipes]|nr:hypothetical protein TNCV_2794941 [Trichonephila clavipes]